jgi:hypothetical protein
MLYTVRGTINFNTHVHIKKELRFYLIYCFLHSYTFLTHFTILCIPSDDGRLWLKHAAYLEKTF